MSSAPVDTPATTLPLLMEAEATRVFAWRSGQAVTVDAFLADVATVAAQLPDAPEAVNLCANRYAFLVAFCALLVRRQTNLLPPSRAPLVLGEILAAHEGSYALSDALRAPAPTATVLLSVLDGTGQAPGSVPLIGGAQLAVIGFTSGSTGQPGANRKPWRSLRRAGLQDVAAVLDALAPAPGTITQIVATVPPQHMYGIEMSVLLPLLGPFAVSDRHPLLPADVAAALAEVPAPRLLVSTPVHLQALLRAGVELPPLELVVSATAPLARELAASVEERFATRVFEVFGSTETCVIAHRFSAREEHWQLQEGVRLRPLEDGTVVETPALERPVKLADQIELLPARRFALRGRQADLLEIAGKRASLADLTRRLLALPGVTDAVVFQTDDCDALGVRRIAALAVAPERSEAELLAALRAAIDPAFLPRPLRMVAALPRNETGKLPRQALIAMLRERR